jgi:AraC-like DNA-binding protein
MTIAPLDLILLLGSVQGFIVGVLLWNSRSGNRLSNRLLALVIGSMALMSLAVGIPLSNPWVSLAIDMLPVFMVMPVGPLIYFYTKSVLDPTFRLRRADWLHFYPVILDWVAPLMGWTFLTGLLLGFFEEKEGLGWGHAMQSYKTYADIPRWLSITLYLFLTRRLLVTYSSAPTGSKADQARRRWLIQFVTAFLFFQALWLLFLVPYIVPNWRGPLLDQLGWYPIYIPISILIYWLGLRGYLQSRLETEPEPIAKPTSIEPELVAQVVNSLTQAMTTDQLYLNPELTVDKVGKHIQLSPKVISAVLNQQLQTNFNSYVNRYRVEAVKRQLTTQSAQHLTLTGIAFDCGFNSQATFQRAFRQQTGLSPTEFLAQQGKNSTQIRI